MIGPQTQIKFSAAALVWVLPWFQLVIQATQIWMVPMVDSSSGTNVAMCRIPNPRHSHGPLVVKGAMDINANHGYDRATDRDIALVSNSGPDITHDPR